MNRKPNRSKGSQVQAAAGLKVLAFSGRTRWLVPAFLVLFVLLGLGLRASDLGADSPPALSWSFAPHTDEGLNTYSARNMVLYGSWKVDDFFPFVVYPLFNFLVSLVYRLLGIGFVQARLVSLLAAALSIWVLYLLLRDEVGELAGLIGALALATCYPLVMYNRLGLVETLQILFLLLAGLFFSRGMKQPWQMGLAGLFAAGTVLLVKISAVFLAPVVVVVLAWQFIESRKDKSALALLGRGTLFLLAGVTAAVLVWFLAVFLPHRADYVQYVLRHSFESPAGHPTDVAGYLFNTFTVGAQSWLVPKLAWVAVVGFLFLPAIARRAGLRYLLVWFVFGVLMLGYMNYRPPRYEIIMLPPLVAGFGVVLGMLVEKGRLQLTARPTVLRSVLYGLWLWPLATQLVLYTNGLWGAVRADTQMGVLWASLGVGFGMAALGFALLRLLRREPVVSPVWARAVLAGILLLLALRLDLTQHAGWYRERTHNMLAYSRELDRILPDSAVLAGGWAPALMMESRKRALCITDWANVDRPVEAYGVTHVVGPENSPDLNLFNELYPGLLARARLLRKFYVQKVTIAQQRKSYALELYELPGAAP